MTIHLRGIHGVDHFRSDVRAQRQRVDDTNDRLRDELADRLPLRWPLSSSRHANPQPERN